MKASIITIGDEILIGQIVDTNSAWIGQELTYKGIQVVKIYSISDTLEEIKNTLALAENESDLIFITGGLGPTKDDITKLALCQYFDVETYFAQELHDKVLAYFNMRGIPFIEAHKAQFNMPNNAELLTNNVGTAPGMLFKENNKLFISTPGVPHEMKWIFNNSLMPILDEVLNSGQNIYKKTVRTIGIGESQIAEMIEPITNTMHKDISLAFLPSTGQVRVRLMARSQEILNDEVERHVSSIVEILAEKVYGFEDKTIEHTLQDLFIKNNLKLSTAESCTGGYLAHRLTSISGSSAYYQGSFIVYDNSFKTNFLKVKEETLSKKGAVSEETVIEMLSGLLSQTKTDLGIAVSGIAGPGGGTKEKPVGTIWIAYGSKAHIKTTKLQLGKDRLRNIEYTAVACMNLLRKFILNMHT